MRVPAGRVSAFPPRSGPRMWATAEAQLEGGWGSSVKGPWS